MSDDDAVCAAGVKSRKAAVAALGGAVAIGALVYMLNLVWNPNTWLHGAGIDGEERERATQFRGALTSLTSSFTFGLVVMSLNSRAYVDQLSSVALMSLLLGNVIGFVADVAFASDLGTTDVQTAKDNSLAMRRGFASLVGTDFARYLVTMLLDLFLSSILVDRVLVSMMSTPTSSSSALKRFVNCNPGKSLFPTLISVMVSTITFYAYTNATRFLFAIRPSRFPRTPDEYAKRTTQTAAYATMPSGPDFKEFLNDALSAAAPSGEGIDAVWKEVFAGGATMRGDEMGFETREQVRTATKEQLRQRGFSAESARMMEAMHREMDVDAKRYLDSTLVLLATSIAGVLYLVTDLGDNKGIYMHHRKAATVVGAFALMFAMVAADVVDSPGSGDTSTGTVVGGLAVFGLLVSACIGGTLATSKAPHTDKPHAYQKKMAFVLILGICLAAVLSTVPINGTERSYIPLVVLLLTVIVYLLLLRGNSTANKAHAESPSPVQIGMTEEAARTPSSSFAPASDRIRETAGRAISRLRSRFTPRSSSPFSPDHVAASPLPPPATSPPSPPPPASSPASSPLPPPATSPPLPTASSSPSSPATSLPPPLVMAP